MLYLEDYLEMIEHLPQELRDRFTEMREMDLQVQNAMDSLDERVKTLFMNAKKMKPEQRDIEYEKIRQDYYKALEDADEKVQIANQIYDLVDRYLRRLDQELQKFKMELEADNAGITEVLEKRSLELDNPPPGQNNKAEKRKYQTSAGGVVLSNNLEKRPALDKDKVNVEKEQLTFRGLINSNHPASNSSFSSSSSSTLINPFTSQNASTGGITGDAGSTRAASQPAPALSYNIGHMGAGSNAIAAAASQAIAATQQMQQGRRTASLKASYEAINSGLQTIRSEFSLGGRGSGAGVDNNLSSSSNPTLPQVSEPKVGRPKKQSTKSSHHQNQNPVSPMLQNQSSVGSSSELDLDVTIGSGDGTFVDDTTTASGNDWAYDPNEPRYCICNQVSYGDMVACDNAD
ncbi:ING3 (predicted), partial [Pycnogonum litorale]